MKSIGQEFQGTFVGGGDRRTKKKGPQMRIFGSTEFTPEVAEEEYRLSRGPVRNGFGEREPIEDESPDMNPEERFMILEGDLDGKIRTAIEAAEDEILRERATLLVRLVDEAAKKSRLRSRNSEPGPMGRPRGKRLPHPVARRLSA